ncbi:early nodulin-like protein 2 [Ischnura elegans]|uniref:early nodulin-like protein 2 n=1 Tax=Ischnura elegans TaxID=197161 RepID=UPI001ED8B795|nr:early nodulin-like protein 2 [Ischnura elegans]
MQCDWKLSVAHSRQGIGQTKNHFTFPPTLAPAAEVGTVLPTLSTTTLPSSSGHPVSPPTVTAVDSKSSCPVFADSHPEPPLPDRPSPSLIPGISDSSETAVPAVSDAGRVRGSVRGAAEGSPPRGPGSPPEVGGGSVVVESGDGSSSSDDSSPIDDSDEADQTYDSDTSEGTAAASMPCVGPG